MRKIKFVTNCKPLVSSGTFKVKYRKKIGDKNSNYKKEYVPETDESQRQELYKIAKKHFDKAIYILQKETGIYITLSMAEALAENYAVMRVYNYIGATANNIPWYLIYSFHGFPLYHMMVRKNTVLHKHLTRLGLELRLELKDSKLEEYVYVENNEGYLLVATNYRYEVGENESISEWLDFSIIRPDENIKNTLLYVPVDRFSIQINSHDFENLIHCQNWSPRQNLLDIAEKYMDP